MNLRNYQNCFGFFHSLELSLNLQLTGHVKLFQLTPFIDFLLPLA
jgi:hypothetical protein